MSIFKNEYLNPEYLNHHYRGLVGWPCEVYDVVGGYHYCTSYLHLTHEEWVVIIDSDGGEMALTINEYGEKIKVPQFTPQDIPVGELCWVKKDIEGSRWRLRVFRGVSKDGKFECDGALYDFIVPYLIASTPEEAEERKEWANV